MWEQEVEGQLRNEGGEVRMQREAAKQKRRCVGPPHMTRLYLCEQTCALRDHNWLIQGPQQVGGVGAPKAGKTSLRERREAVVVTSSCDDHVIRTARKTWLRAAAAER